MYAVETAVISGRFGASAENRGAGFLRVKGIREDCKLSSDFERPRLMRHEPVEAPQDIPAIAPEVRRERVVRRRRARSSGHHHKHKLSWTARASRRKVVRVFLLCAGVLVLMAIGLYFGLARQDVAPVEGAAPPVTASSRAV
jgi:hypothetical protein